MAKGLALTKRAKISESQKYMILAVFVTSVVLGVTIAVMVHFIETISFNGKIISEEDKSINAFSQAIKTTGTCTSPKGDTYTDEELNGCNPTSIEISRIPNTLRYNVLNNLAANENLNSVPKETNSSCINPEDNKNYTYEELMNMYNKAASDNDTAKLDTATNLLKSCSALRIIPDALPSYRNEEALLASLNKLFLESNWQPESLSPGGLASSTNLPKGLNALSVSLSIEADSGTTMSVLGSIERSIREFNIERATIEWSGEDTLSLQAAATAYYMNPSSIVQSTKSVKPGDKK